MDEIAVMMEATNPDPNFLPDAEVNQGKLDEKSPVTCPNCNNEFIPS
jgi:hypothetical protein